MAITASTKLSDFSGFLNREQSEAIFTTAYQSSVVQQLSRRVPLGFSGKSIPVVTGKVTAGWVAEGAQKPASSGTMALKTMDPKKLAAIAVVSAEVVRANPGGYMDILRPQIAEAFIELLVFPSFQKLGFRLRQIRLHREVRAWQIDRTLEVDGSRHASSPVLKLRL